MMIRSRQFLYLTFNGMVGLLALTVLACSSDDEATPTSPTSVLDAQNSCTYTHAISQTTFAFAGGTAQLTVTASPATCGWYAEEPSSSEDWLSVSAPTCTTDSGDSAICYGMHTVTITAISGDVPAGYPAPRAGEVVLWKKVGESFDKVSTIALAQSGQ